MRDDELARVYGLGLPQVGLDQELQSGRARSVDVAFVAERTSNQTRDVIDNWNVQVADPLIAQAILESRQ